MAGEKTRQICSSSIVHVHQLYSHVSQQCMKLMPKINFTQKTKGGNQGSKFLRDIYIKKVNFWVHVC